MTTSPALKRLSVPRVLVEAIVVMVMFSGATIARASTNSSWSTQSGWDSDTNNNTNHQNESSSTRSHSANKSIATATAEDDKVSPFAPGTHNLALEMGQVFLMGNLGNNYSDAIGTQVHYTYGVSDLFGFDSSVGYSSHSGGNYSMFSALAGMRTNLAWYDKIVPYFSFGLGFYRPSYSGSGSASGSSQVMLPAGDSVSALLFGVHMGPGVDLEVTKHVFFGASLTLHDMFGSTQTVANNQNVNTGGIYTSFLLHAGVTF
ncbi:MAG: hypothetical protein P4M08_04805 [Oligoflexia bacterium]|nr:hypothetical protein [Oligoflexia bacterium]